jgi:hypothetical protein
VGVKRPDDLSTCAVCDSDTIVINPMVTWRRIPSNINEQAIAMHRTDGTATLGVVLADGDVDWRSKDGTRK